MEDRDIVALYLQRDERAIQYTAEKYGSRLWTLALGITGDGQSAEECENDAYLAAWNTIPPRRPEDYFFPFLARIVRNQALNLCRGREARKRSARVEETVRRPRRRGMLLLAACLCLTMAAAAFAAGPGRIWLKETFSGRRLAPDYMESGFLLGTEPERVPLSLLSQRVRDAGEIIAGQYRDYSPLSSKAPGQYSPKFTAQQEVLDYVGYAPLRGVALDAREEGSTLILRGDEAGTILSVTVRTQWKAGQDVRGETRAQLYTEKYDGETDIGSITTEEIQFQTEEKTSASGWTYVEVSSDPLTSGYETLEGHLLDGSVIYSIHLAFQGEERDTARQLLEQWAEQF